MDTVEQSFECVMCHHEYVALVPKVLIPLYKTDDYGKYFRPSLKTPVCCPDCTSCNVKIVE